MPDPLSITASIVGLLEVTGSVASELHKFHRATQVVDKTVLGLQHDVESLQEVLESMRLTFANITAAKVTETGHIGSLWINVSRSIVDGKEVLGHLNIQIQNVNKETKLLDNHRKQVRLNRAQPQIAEFRTHIQSFKDGLGLSLQAIILWNQETHQQTVSQVLPSLSELHADVRRIALAFNEKIDLLESKLRTENNESLQVEVNAIRHLKECVRSAASTISSALSIRKSTRDSITNDSVLHGSEFEDRSLTRRNVRQWMESHPAHGFNDDDQISRARSIANVVPLEGSDNDTGSDADSDAELEAEIIEAMMQSGKQKFEQGLTDGASRQLQKCLERLESRQPIRGPVLMDLQSEIVDSLCLVYVAQENWDLAQKMCLQKLQIKERQGSKSTYSFVKDVLRLAHVNMRKGDLIDAELHARRALKEARKVENTEGMSSALKILISIGEEKQDENEIEAYTVMLENTISRSSRTIAADAIDQVDPTYTTNLEIRNALDELSSDGQTNPQESDCSPLSFRSPGLWVVPRRSRSPIYNRRQRRTSSPLAMQSDGASSPSRPPPSRGQQRRGSDCSTVGDSLFLNKDPGIDSPSLNKDFRESSPCHWDSGFDEQTFDKESKPQSTQNRRDIDASAAEDVTVPAPEPEPDYGLVASSSVPAPAVGVGQSKVDEQASPVDQPAGPFHVAVIGYAKKSALILALSDKRFGARECIRSGRDGYSIKGRVDGRAVVLRLWDGPMREGPLHTKSSTFDKTHVYLVCFSIANPMVFAKEVRLSTDDS